MKRLIWFLALFPWLLQAQSQSEKKVDSITRLLKNPKTDTTTSYHYNSLSRALLYQNGKDGIEYANKALSISRKIKWEKGEGQALTSIGMHQISLGEYENARLQFSTAEKILKKVNDKASLARLYNQLGILNANQGKFPESLDFFFKSLRNFESFPSKYSYSKASCYENIGTVYTLTESYDNAIENYQKAILILRSMPAFKQELAMNIVNLGIVYQKQDRLQESVAEFKKAELLMNVAGDDFGKATLNSWYAMALAKLKDYDGSISRSVLALKNVKKSNDQELTATIFQSMGDAYLRRKRTKTDLDSAQTCLIRARDIHLKLNNHEGLIKDYLYLSDYYKAIGDFEKSLETHTLFSVYTDSVFNFKNKQSLKNLEDARTIELGEKELEISKLNVQAKERQKWFYIIGIFAILGVAGLIYRQSRNRQKTNEKLRELNAELDAANKTKARFFGILNHDLRSPVSRLISFLHLQKESPELLDDESRIRMEEKTITAAENLLESMEDILLWSKHQMENFRPEPRQFKIAGLFDDLQQHFASVSHVKFVFSDNEKLSLHTDTNYLKTILRNIIGNAVKAVESKENATIQIVASSEGKQTFITVKDNGPGANEDQFRALFDESAVTGLHSGLGLHLIRDMAKAIGCDVSVDSKPGEGTTFTLRLKQS